MRWANDLTNLLLAMAAFALPVAAQWVNYPTAAFAFLVVIPSSRHTRHHPSAYSFTGSISVGISLRRSIAR